MLKIGRERAYCYQVHRSNNTHTIAPPLIYYDVSDVNKKCWHCIAITNLKFGTYRLIVILLMIVNLLRAVWNGPSGTISDHQEIDDIYSSP